MQVAARACMSHQQPSVAALDVRYGVRAVKLKPGGNVVVVKKLRTVSVECRIKNIALASCMRVLEVAETFESCQQCLIAMYATAEIEKSVAIGNLQAAWMPPTQTHSRPVTDCIFDDARLVVVDGQRAGENTDSCSAQKAAHRASRV